MDDLQSKSDDELKALMRASISNQYVPTSIYHRAKQELDFRSARVVEQDKDLAPIEKAVLLAISKSKIGSATSGKFISIEVLEHKFGEKLMPKVHEALKRLDDRGFIEEVEDYDGEYHLTPLGDSYLDDRHASSVVNYSNISHSNIAHQSQAVSQRIDIRTLPDDIQRSLDDLHVAAEKRDASGMKKAFAYIADKAVDVAIAITAGHVRL